MLSSTAQVILHPKKPSSCVSRRDHFTLWRTTLMQVSLHGF